MTAASRMKQVFQLLVAIGVCAAVAAAGNLVTWPNVGNWYAGIAKPTWTPPNWLFGPVWSVLYLMMAIAAWLVWQRDRAAVPLALFGVQLLLNGAWSWLFFGLHSPGAALIDIILLWAAIFATTVAFWRTSKPAATLLLPYLAWVSFASVLNVAIWLMNS